MIGLIFPIKKLKRILTRKESLENVQFYYDLASEYKVDLLFYSLKNIDFDNNLVDGYHFSFKAQSLENELIKLPKINIVRTILRRKQTYYKLKQLEQKNSIQFINLIPERNKYKIYQFFIKNDELKQYTPDTALLTYKTMNDFLSLYNKIIIKPINGYLGERVYFIEKQTENYFIKYTRNKKQFTDKISNKELSDFFQDHFQHNSLYLIQPWIHFKKYKDKIFDVRISIQKNVIAKWEITGIVTRIANGSSIVTNVAQGGKAIPFADVACILEADSQEKINQLSLKVAETLEKLYPSTMDLGLDIGIDEENNLWFIEANFCDQRYAYKLANNHNMWLTTYRVPFEYAVSKYLDSEE